MVDGAWCMVYGAWCMACADMVEEVAVQGAVCGCGAVPWDLGTAGH